MSAPRASVLFPPGAMHEALTEVADPAGSDDAPVRRETPLPWKTVVVLGIVVLSDSISGTVIFPFQGFMVDDFRIAASTSQIGMHRCAC